MTHAIGRPALLMLMTRARTLSAVVAAAACVALTGCGGGTDPLARAVTPPTTPAARPTLPQTYRASGHAAAGDVFVHLFEWRWNDVANECEQVLGPSGYRGVQVSPPQEHLVATGNPWWERYQPVSYSIARSRSGTGAEFAAMVQRCKAAGVDVYVDAVINHMTAGSGTGSNGTKFTKYEYPGVWTQGDFHTPCIVNDYSSAANVQDCELVGLADLATGNASVQQKLADFLASLARLGVAGFRIDAAKHIQPLELDAIVNKTNAMLAAEGRPIPWYYGEVIDHGGEGVAARDYYGIAYASGGTSDITEFRFTGTGDKFLGLSGQRVTQLNPDGAQGSQFSQLAWSLMPSDKAVVFLENHDTQRGSGVGYRDGQTYRLANVWMLAQPYGYPMVMSSYAFDRSTQAGRDAGPPSDASGNTNAVHCAATLEVAALGDWVCEHRDAFIVAMVKFRRVVGNAPQSDWWDDGQNAIAFSRGNRGFVALNRGTGAVTATVKTGMTPGAYCDLLSGGATAAGGCAGVSIVVDASGNVALKLDANAAIAIDIAARP